MNMRLVQMHRHITRHLSQIQKQSNSDHRPGGIAPPQFIRKHTRTRSGRSPVRGSPRVKTSCFENQFLKCLCHFLPIGYTWMLTMKKNVGL